MASIDDLIIPEDSQQNELGFISSQFESAGDISKTTNNPKDPGGISLGRFQFIAPTFKTFLKSEEGKKFAPDFEGVTLGESDSIARFKEKITPEMDVAMRRFITNKSFEPVRKLAKERGFDTSSKVIQEFLFSSSVQHSTRGNKQILDNFIKDNPNFNELNDDQLIEGLFNARNTYAQRFLKDPGIKKAVENRLLKDEPEALKSFAKTLQPKGQLTTGNIDLSNRPQVQNPDGSISTIRSISIGTDQGEVLIPTIAPDGQELTEEQAIERFRQTGENLGSFDTPETATEFAKNLSIEQGERILQPQPVLREEIGDTPLPEETAQPELLDPQQALDAQPFITEEERQRLSQVPPFQVAGPAFAPASAQPTIDDLIIEEPAPAPVQAQVPQFQVADPITAPAAVQTIDDLIVQDTGPSIDDLIIPSAPVALDSGEVREPEIGFVSGLTQGLRQNLTGLAVAGLQGDALKVASEEARFRSVSEGLGYITGQFLDPVAIPLALTGGGAAVKVGQFFKIGSQIALRASVKEGAKAVQKGILRQAIKQSIKAPAKGVVGKTIAKAGLQREPFNQAVLRSAGEALGVTAGRAALDPAVSAEGLAGEAVIGTVLGSAFRGAGKLLARRREAGNLQKVLNLTVKQQQLDDAFKEASSVRKAVQRQIDKRAKAGEKAGRLDPQRAFDEVLVERLGGTIGKPKVFLQSFTSPLKLASRFDEAFGTNTFDSVSQFVQNANVRDAVTLDIGKNLTGIKNKLNKLGRTNSDITDLLEHVDRAGNFIPDANVSRDVYTGALPSPEELGVLQELRGAFNTVRELTPDVPSRNFFSPRYFKRQEGGAFRVSKRFDKAQDAVRGSFEQQRRVQRFKTDLHEDDFQTIIDRYAAEQGKVLAYREPIENMSVQVQRLKALGRTDEANTMSRLVADVLNLRDTDVSDVFLAKNRLQGARTRVAQLLADRPEIEPELGSKLLQKTNQIMSEAFLFAKPLSTIKNALQVDIIGPGEVGSRYLQMGRNVFSKARKVAAEHIDIMKTPTLDFADLQVVQRKGGGVVYKAGEFARAPFKVTFNLQDTLNRKRAFAGAYEQWDDLVPQGQIANVLDGLLPSESAQVLRTLQSQGDEAAKVLYSLTRSRRINFAYTIADKPEVLRKGALRYIPFTTWGRNVGSRILQDLTEKNVSKVASRLAAPVIVMELLRSAGIEIRGIHPLSSAVGIMSPDFNPLLSSLPGAIIEATQVASGQKEFDLAQSRAAGLIPGVATLKAGAKALQSLEDDEPLGVLGIKEADVVLDNENLPQRMINDILNPYRLRNQ